jgi:ribose 5-phosphate isomerase B
MSLKIAIGADHAGFEYKQPIVDFLKSKGYEVLDFGTNSLSSVDYPEFAHPVSLSVGSEESTFGVLICGSAQGVSITANKHQGIRAAVVWVNEIAELSRLHNNANVICLPARFITIDTALNCVETFLNTEFEGGRHANRVGKISC